MPWRRNKKGRPVLWGTCRLCRQRVRVRQMEDHYDHHHPAEYDKFREIQMAAMDRDEEDEAVETRRDRWRD